MLVSLAETFFIFVIGFLTVVFAYYAWVSITPKLPIKIPPVLVCIVIGCCMRLAAKPLLESPSADSAFDEWSTSSFNEAAHSPVKNQNVVVESEIDMNQKKQAVVVPATTTSSAAANSIVVALGEEGHRQYHKKIKKLHIYGEGVVRTVSNPIIGFGLSCVGILIGSHIDVGFLRKNTRPLLALTFGCALFSYIFTFLAGFVLWQIHLLPFIHLVASAAMERSSSEALATIGESKIMSSPNTTKSALYFVRSTIFAAAAMDVIAVVVFVFSMGIIEKGAGSAHETILEIVLGTSFVAGMTLVLLKFHLTIEQRILQPIIVKWKLSDQPFSILKRHDRAAILVLCTLVASNYVIPGNELLLAAVACGMKISYDEQQQQQQQQQQDDPDDIDRAEDEAKLSTNGNPTPSKSKAANSGNTNPHGSNGNSIISTIEKHSIFVYSVLFSIIGLRLDAAQLAQTLIANPTVSFSLFFGRFFGLCVGGFVGSFVGGKKGSTARKFMKWRGPSLVTRIAVSIILLQKMEDVFVGSKEVVHAAIGAVLIDMCVGPGLLQWGLKKVVEESQNDARKKVVNGDEAVEGDESDGDVADDNDKNGNNPV